MEGGFRYMDNRKPVAPLIGANGNIFNLLSIARNSLISSNQHNKADEMWDRVTNSKSYNEALIIISDYVEFGDSDERTTGGHGGFNGSEETIQQEIRGQVVKSGIDGTAGIVGSKVGKVGTLIPQDSIREFNSIEVDFIQKLHISNTNIDEIMSIVLGEGILNWYESISSSPTSIEKVETNLISSGGTIFFRIQGEDYSRTFDKHDLIYGLLRVLPDCLYVINGIQIDTLLLDYDNIDHIVQYGLFGRIRFDDEQMESRAEDNE